MDYNEQSKWSTDSELLLVKLTKDFLGIEEVTDPVLGEDVIDGGNVDPNEIEEVNDPSEEKDVINGGEISMRNYITTTILSLWVIWNFVGLVEFMKTGNTVLLLTPPTLMSIPLYKILRYHFRV